jgi:hypothetical protein
MLIGTLLAAVNTGNNLVYLALGLLCGVLVLSNALAEWNLRGLTVTRRFPPRRSPESRPGCLRGREPPALRHRVRDRGE